MGAKKGRCRTLVGVRIGEHLHTSRDEVVLELAPVVLLRVDKLMGEGGKRGEGFGGCGGCGERLRTLMQSQ